MYKKIKVHDNIYSIYIRRKIWEIDILLKKRIVPLNQTALELFPVK